MFAFNRTRMKLEHSSLTPLMAVFDVLAQNVSPTARCKHIQLFLRIVMNEGASISELHRNGGSGSLSATFKLVRELSARSWRKEAKKSASEKRVPGLGLVRLEPDPVDERVKRVYLSEKGKKFIEELCQVIKS